MRMRGRSFRFVAIALALFWAAAGVVGHLLVPRPWFHAVVLSSIFWVLSMAGFLRERRQEDPDSGRPGT